MRIEWLTLTALLAAGCNPKTSVGPTGQKNPLPLGTDAGSGVADAGEADAGSPDAGPSDGGWVESPHSVSAVPNEGGSALARPIAVAITFANDPNRAHIDALSAFLPGSTWLKTVSPEYGIGSLGHVEVELPQDAPSAMTDTDLQNLLQSLLASGTVPGGTPDGGAASGGADGGGADGGGSDAGIADGGTMDAGISDGGISDGGSADAGSLGAPQYVYLFFLPVSTSFTTQGQGLCSISGGGYHSETQLTNLDVPYAVIQPCPGQGLSDVQILDLAGSHELIEALTDPYPYTNPAWVILDPQSPWSYIGGEVGDVCSYLAPQWKEGSFDDLQRVWSNRSATDGGDPCLPAVGTYFGTAISPATIVQGQPGGSVDFQLTGWSTAPVADWTLQAFNGGSQGGPSFDGTPTLSSYGMNDGESATLTVHVPSNAASQSYAMVIVLSGGSQNDYTASVAMVYVP